MGISSLGAGSSILTQDLIDQLKAADEAKFIRPIDTSLKVQKEKSAAFGVLDALMDNVYQSLKGLTEFGVFESRIASATDDSIANVDVNDGSDIQDFKLEVTHLATKEIEQSGKFTTRTSVIADGNGKLDLSVGSEIFTFDYDSETTLENIKDAINKDAGDSVNATIVQVADDDFRLLLTAANTGTNQEISIVDKVGAGEHLFEMLKEDTDTTDGMTNVQIAVDASFKFNGLDITRSSNVVDDLLSGVTITLKDAGNTNISVKQNREYIESKITNFIDKYNSVMYQLNEDTKASQDIEERGVFSGNSTIKGMKSAMVNILSTIGEGQGKIQDYGIEVDEDGRLSLDAKKLNKKLDDDATSTQSFFVGGTFTKLDGTTTEMKGIFSELEDEVEKYSKYNAVLDQFKTSMSTRTESLNEQKIRATKRLEANYEIMAKRFAAYDLMINKFNSASQMFSQMIEAEIAANRK
jgi:flagellar hook-associated protein 2